MKHKKSHGSSALAKQGVGLHGSCHLGSLAVAVRIKDWRLCRRGRERGVLDGTHGEVLKDGPRNGRSGRAAIRRRTWTAHLQQLLQAGLGAVAGAHEDVAQRKSPETLDEGTPDRK